MSVGDLPRSVPDVELDEAARGSGNVYTYRLPVRQTASTQVHVLLTPRIPTTAVHGALFDYHAAQYHATGRLQVAERKIARARAEEVRAVRDAKVAALTTEQELAERLRRLRCHGK